MPRAYRGRRSGLTGGPNLHLYDSIRSRVAASPSLGRQSREDDELIMHHHRGHHRAGALLGHEHHHAFQSSWSLAQAPIVLLASLSPQLGARNSSLNPRQLDYSAPARVSGAAKSPFGRQVKMNGLAAKQHTHAHNGRHLGAKAGKLALARLASGN